MRVDPDIYLEAAEIVFETYLTAPHRPTFSCITLIGLGAYSEARLFSEYFNPYNGHLAWFCHTENGRGKPPSMAAQHAHRVTALLLMAEIAKDLNLDKA